MPKKYLFIRILEACNAGCFMCQYARSEDSYRFTPREFADLLPQARALGVHFVRFTGGEPLLHQDVIELIRDGSHACMKMSLITNGMLLSKMAVALAQAGLTQVIVSIDGAAAQTHDRYRRTQGLFDNAVAGLRAAREQGLLTRVNSVVGPHNYREMPELQKSLSSLGVEQWELSPIKLDKMVKYPNREEVLSVCEGIYRADPKTTLIPLGKRFYGNTPLEQELYFARGITPRPAPPQCRLVGDVIYLDAKNGRGYGCSLLPHRNADESQGGALLRREGNWILDDPAFFKHVDYFRARGPSVCTGCSTTAAGYSDASLGSASPDWSF